MVHNEAAGRLLAPDDHVVLMRRVSASRDREAFTLQFDHFAPRILAFLLKMGTDRAAAEELTQDVMATVWRKADLFDPEKSSLVTWLFRIARNRRIDAIRRDKSDRLTPDEPMLLPGELPQPDADLMADQRDTPLRAALEMLPEEQKSLVVMSFFDNLSHSEIADRTGVPLGTVKSRIRLAFGHMRRHLDERGLERDDL